MRADWPGKLHADHAYGPLDDCLHDLTVSSFWKEAHNPWLALSSSSTKLYNSLFLCRTSSSTSHYLILLLHHSLPPCSSVLDGQPCTRACSSPSPPSPCSSLADGLRRSRPPHAPPPQGGQNTRHTKAIEGSFRGGDSELETTVRRGGAHPPWFRPPSSVPSSDEIVRDGLRRKLASTSSRLRRRTSAANATSSSLATAPPAARHARPRPSPTSSTTTTPRRTAVSAGEVFTHARAQVDYVLGSNDWFGRRTANPNVVVGDNGDVLVYTGSGGHWRRCSVAGFFF